MRYAAINDLSALSSIAASSLNAAKLHSLLFFVQSYSHSFSLMAAYLLTRRRAQWQHPRPPNPPPIHRAPSRFHREFGAYHAPAKPILYNYPRIVLVHEIYRTSLMIDRGRGGVRELRRTSIEWDRGGGMGELQGENPGTRP